MEERDGMKRSAERLLTTHTGSLPRPAALREAETDGYEEALRGAVDEVVRLQVEAGIDIVSDGEMSKPDYSTYITERATGFGGQGAGLSRQLDAEEFPEWGAQLAAAVAEAIPTPACIGEVRRTDSDSVERDVANLTSAVADAGAVEGFMTAASPGVITLFLENQHYPSHDAYLESLADVMREEYEAIHRSGLILQIDCPDLAVGHHVQFPDLELGDWKQVIRGHIEAVNAATRNIPGEAMRIHLCWGNYEGPHNHDVALREILEIVFEARPAAISFEAANPRHEHEWRVFEEVKLPADKVIIPGVIDSTTNYVEHPELVAERLVRFANLVGRERVIGGTDCGFATFADFVPVFPSIAYAKLGSLAEGAQLASRQLW
jgi:5-methyltetrahydropteroyltriglutamate--homocysteine methyltransferase